ncbi:MAG TPA: carboxypeptidase-like regulatory domain-containing protein, partial [Cyclobacteriaceae bacterium]|nr:carboxypeptidase-like regulatory domain-containing protein [Cyclobacteriaceae bacterium]
MSYSGRFRILQISAFLFLPWLGFCQSILKDTISYSSRNFDDFVSEIEMKYPARFFYESKWVKDFQLGTKDKSVTLEATLNDFIAGTDLFYVVFDNYSIVIAKDPAQSIKRLEIIQKATLEKKKIETVSFGDGADRKRAQTVTLRGQVINYRTNEPLAGASISLVDLEKGTSSDAKGKYAIAVPPGLHVLKISYLNFEDRVIDLMIYKDGELATSLTESPILLDEVVVSDKSHTEVTNNKIGSLQMSMTEIKRKPAILGEVDIIKQLQQMPGVTTASEAASGFNV